MGAMEKVWIKSTAENRRQWQMLHKVMKTGFFSEEPQNLQIHEGKTPFSEEVTNPHTGENDIERVSIDAYEIVDVEMRANQWKKSPKAEPMDSIVSLDEILPGWELCS